MSELGLEAISSAVQNRITALARRAAADRIVTMQIPALRNVDPRKFGVAVATSGGDTITFGAAYEPFSLQGLSRSLRCALWYPSMLEPGVVSVGAHRPTTTTQLPVSFPSRDRQTPL